MLSPSTDGIDHINVYSQGKTELGRLLTNFANTPFVCEDGAFTSVEGYWYWLGTREPILRTVHGYKAKQLGKTFTNSVSLDADIFRTKIRKAINAKINAHPHIKQLLKESTLPLEHYYVFNGIVKDAGYKWILEHLNNVRVWLKIH